MQFKKFSKHSQEIYAVESVFILLGDRYDSSKCLKNSNKDGVFLGIFRNFQNMSFSECPLKNVSRDYF